MLVPITDYEFAQHYGTENALNYVWDVPTLSWVKSTGGGGGGGGAVTVADGADVAQGTTTDAAWVAGNGTVIALLKKIAGAGGAIGPVSLADGADVAEGALADAAVVTDTTGTVSGKLRGLVKWAFERMPAALGQGTMAQSLRVVLASDQSAVSVSGTFFQATQPVSNAGLTNLDVALSTRLKPADTLTAVTTLGTITNVVHVDDNAGSLTVDGTVAISGSVAVTGPLTDAQLRATPVPVSGTVTANAGTNLNTSALSLEATQALVKAKTDNLDVALSTRLKPADTLAAVTSITNVVHVDDNAGSLTVDGTVTANAGTGPWPVTDNGGSLTVDGTVGVSGSVAVTNANLDVALSTLATAAAQTTGNASLSAIAAKDFATQATLAALYAALGLVQGVTSVGVLGPMVQALVSDAVESYTDVTVRPLSLNSEGRLRVQTAGESHNFTPWGSPETWGNSASYDAGILSAWG